MESITMEEVLGKEGCALAERIWNEDRQNFRARLRDEVILPRMTAINSETGQENNADYLAYACEYVMGKYRKG